MSICSGYGECLTQCICECLDETGNPLVSCICGHRQHIKFITGPTDGDVYCNGNCPYDCQPMKCHNYVMCEKKRPQYQLDSDGEMCRDCAIMIGRIKFLETRSDCPVCFENRDIIEISCGNHNICYDCWKEWTKKYNQFPLTCPLCSSTA
jgi:hypothetical protein